VLTTLFSVARVVGFLKAILLPLAVLFGRFMGKREVWAELDAKNNAAQKEYQKIDEKDLSDDEVDKRLDEGSI
jgi:hypothetical protein